MLIDPARLTAPVDDASPCGDDLEYDPAFIALQAAAETRPEQQVGGSIIPAEEPDWPAVARDAIALLDRCRDLRVAAILADAAVRTEGMPGFAAVLQAVRGWLESYWAELHPRLDPDDDDDPTMRVNAMTAFTKLQASEGPVLRGLRATPLTNSRGFGRFTWRHLLIATGELSAPEGEQVPSLAEIGAAFEDTDAQERAATAAAVVSALQHARAIDAVFSERIGTAGPDLDPLIAALQKLGQMLATHARLEAPAQDEPATAAMTAAAYEPAALGSPAPARGGQSGTIASRDDVIRALDRICEFYERMEPSSPVPLLLKRARRLVNADFTTIIRDMASDGYDQVVRIAGIAEE